MGRYVVLEDVAVADCALEIDGRDLNDLFETVARAVAELIFLKDSEQLILTETSVEVEGQTPCGLVARVAGGRIDRERTLLRADAKAPTFHRFGVEPEGDGWRARVVIDI